MYKTYIKLASADNIKDFVSGVKNFELDIDLRTGAQTVDGKSYLGICTLDLNRPIEVNIISKKDDDLTRFIKFITEKSYLFLD